MISFAKHIAVLAAALIATTTLAEKSSDKKSATPDPKGAAEKKPANGPGSESADQPVAPKKMDVPVIKGHDSKGLVIPYYNSTGKHEMQFHIGVASRLDDNHVDMTNLLIETYDEQGQKEMHIDLPRAILDTDTSVVTSKRHVTIKRDDFVLTGETMIFNTRTKQGGLGGNVRMLIFNLKEQTTPPAESGEDQAGAKKPKTQFEPDTFRTPQSRMPSGAASSKDNTEKFLTPGNK